VLPYDEKYGFIKLRGLNTLEPTENPKRWYESILNVTKCQFVDDECSSCSLYSFNHYNECFVCVKHYNKSQVNEFKKKKDEKQRIKDEKQKAKEERKRVREEKQKLKEQKQEKIKEQKKVKQEKLNQQSQEPLILCKAILKSGVNKGRVCGCKLYSTLHTSKKIEELIGESGWMVDNMGYCKKHHRINSVNENKNELNLVKI
jgi:Na+-translocating ferredoxin:NAD+ oxidoreductase RnfC subunit